MSLLVIFLSILCVSGTIALRNVVHLILLAMVSYSVYLLYREDKKKMLEKIKVIPWVLWVWTFYLLIFPLFAVEKDVAWSNIIGKGMWGEAILTWVVAWGALVVVGERPLSMWTLALASATPVFIHLGLFILAWMGLLDGSFYADPSIQTAAASIFNLFTHVPDVSHAFAEFPKDFRGIEPMHGNIGYSASQATCIALAIGITGWNEHKKRDAIWAMVLVVICTASVLIAGSRGAFYSNLLLIALAFSFYLFGLIKDRFKNGKKIIFLFKCSLAFLGIIFIIACATVYVSKTDVRWYSMWDKLELGLMVPNPGDIICNGLSQSDLDLVKQKFGSKGEEYVDTLKAGLTDQDGARVILTRLGFDLVAKYPWGLDGSREAYQNRVSQYCGHEPVLKFSHAHNAWVNLSLSIGIIGSVIYLSVFLFYILKCINGFFIDVKPAVFWASFFVSFYWIFRGFTDAVFQEQYLQMQLFILVALGLSGDFKFRLNNCKTKGWV